MCKTIDDFTCPECGSINCYECETDEVDFCFNGTGHYYVICHCVDCNNHFKQCYEFKYEITKEWAY